MTKNITVLTAIVCALGLVGCVADVDEINSTGPMPDDPRMQIEDELDWVVAVSHLDELGEHHVCTGTVIGPYAVLTVASCASENPADSAVLTGSDVRYAQPNAVAETIFDPDGGELVVLITEEPLLASVAEISSARVGDLESAFVVGYGHGGTAASVVGVKTGATMEVELLESGDGQLWSPDVALCFGDLGAPIHDETGAVVGVTTGLSASCVSPSRSAVLSLQAASQLITANADRMPEG